MRIRVHPEDRVRVDGTSCELVGTTPAGHVLKAVDAVHPRDPIDHTTFAARVNDGTIVVDRNWFAENEDLGRRGPPVAPLISDFSEEQQAETLFRLSFVQEFESMHRNGDASRTDPGYAIAAFRIHHALRMEEQVRQKEETGRRPRGGRKSSGREAPSGHQLRRWCEAYRSQGNGGLTPRTARSGNRTERFHPVVSEMIERTVRGYCSRNRPSRVAIHQRLRRHVRAFNDRHGTTLSVPSYTTVCARVKELSELDRLVGRESSEEARKTLAISRGGITPTLLLERIEIDEWRVQLQTLLVDANVWRLLTEEDRTALAPIRCWLTAAICCTSSCIVALHLTLDDPSAHSAVSAVRQILIDKTAIAAAAGARTPWDFFGGIEGVVTDKGAGFKSASFRRVVADLKGRSESPPAGLPHLRGRIERFFGTLDRSLLQFFTGRTFANISTKGTYDARAMASLSVEQLRRALIRYVCDVYHHSPQAALGRRSPAQVWKREMACAGVLPPPTATEMRDIFGTSTQRTLGKKGIRFASIQYQSEWLENLWLDRGETTVEIRVDHRDLSAISVSAGHARWVSVNAVAGIRLSAADILAHLKLRAATPPSDLDDAEETRRAIDQALDDLTELGEAARLAAGVPDPVATVEQIDAVRRQVARLWSAHEAKRASSGLDHLAVLSASTSVRTADAEARSPTSSTASSKTRASKSENASPTPAVPSTNLDPLPPTAAGPSGTPRYTKRN